MIILLAKVHLQWAGTDENIGMELFLVLTDDYVAVLLFLRVTQ